MIAPGLTGDREVEPRDRPARLLEALPSLLGHCSQEVDHRVHDLAPVPEKVEEESARKQVAEQVDQQRVRWCVVDPPPFSASARVEGVHADSQVAEELGPINLLLG